MKLRCYRIDDSPVDLRPVESKREWMDRTPEAFAYRCLPLTIANQHGWALCCTESFSAEWNGGAAGSDVEIVRDGEPRMDVVGHFGSGILSFRSNVIFRTAEGFNLWVTGPPNLFKDGIQALSAVVETDWMPFPFAMSWKFTRPGHRVSFEKGEPYCFLFPVERGLLQRCEPSMHRMEDDPEMARQYRVAHYKREFPQAVESSWESETSSIALPTPARMKAQEFSPRCLL